MKLKLLPLIFVSILLISFISAEITLEVNVEDSFGLGEDILYNYTIVSNIDTQAVIIPHIECPSAPVAPLFEKTIELKADQPYAATYTDQIVQDWFESQICTAYVQIINPIQQIVSKNFTINTNPSFSFDILLDKKVFTQNEDIFLDYEFSVENPSITSTLIYPNEEQEQIALPYSFKAEQIGTYELEVTASKEGYKTITDKTQFGVIEGEADIEYGFKEDKSMDKKSNYLIYILIGGFIFILVILIFIAYNLLKKK